MNLHLPNNGTTTGRIKIIPTVITASVLLSCNQFCTQGVETSYESLGIPIAANLFGEYRNIIDRGSHMDDLIVIHNFTSKLLSESIDIPSEFAKILQDQLFDLL
ncbi:MAG: hypothetical protein HGB23_02275 [Chlorobiaceae bacterium]|nr:hypothetical protein [Chlorobiaceae bacterium]